MIDCHTGAQRNRYENGRNPARCFRSYVELYHELDEENTHSISDAISCDKQNTTRRIRVVFLFFSKLRTVVLTDGQSWSVVGRYLENYTDTLHRIGASLSSIATNCYY